MAIFRWVESGLDLGAMEGPPHAASGFRTEAQIRTWRRAEGPPHSLTTPLRRFTRNPSGSPRKSSMIDAVASGRSSVMEWLAS